MLLLLPLVASFASARFVNVTIDDTHGDARTGHLPSYSPDGLWNAVCPGCGAVDVPFDWDRVRQRTIHDAVLNTDGGKANVTLNFNGSAIYVFFAVLPVFGMHIDFYLDSSPRPVETYIRLANATSTGVLYDQLVFKSGPLADVEHSLLISCEYEGAWIAMFDYALYTVRDAGIPQAPAPSQTSGPRRPGARGPSGVDMRVIAASVAGPLAALAIVSGYVLWRRRRRILSGGATTSNAADLTPFSAPRGTAPASGPKDSKLHYRDSISPFYASSRTKEGTAGGEFQASTPGDEGTHAEDTAFLRSELDRVQAENMRLRQVAEPPPYADAQSSTAL
ncbi:hypothetical protein AURDEDRAFT_164321 [Auricularia subglabra TFB-10046 SS5]|nr:hypothetical protein AURDEDRAFT_164321 [Auricularia subglabra TFB-10046 SS5]